MQTPAALDSIGLIDTHCHLEPDDFRRTAPDGGTDAAQFIDERPDVLERAHRAGLVQLVVIGSGHGLDEIRNAVALASSHEALFAAVGVHPHDARTVINPDRPDEPSEAEGGRTPQRATRGPRGEALWHEIETAAAAPRVVAVGETGLDYYYNYSLPEEQQALFRRTLRLSAKVHKPVVLHIRDAHPEALRIVAEEGAPAGGVVHCFTGGPDEARAWLELGFYISLSGIVTFKSAAAIQAAARLVPSDRLLLETDCPYLAPVPHRGKRNEPAYLVHTAAFVAKLRGVALPELAAATTAAARRLFRLPTPPV
ncbi:MAG: TatD family hydrolase [Polyangia bacterium]